MPPLCSNFLWLYHPFFPLKGPFFVVFNSSYFFHKVAKHMFFERHATHDEGALKPPNLELLGFKIFIASVSSSIICFYWKRSILIKCRKRSRKKNRYIDEKKVGQQFFLSNPKTAGWNWCNNGDDAICCTVRCTSFLSNCSFFVVVIMMGPTIFPCIFNCILWWRRYRVKYDKRSWED